MLLAVSQPDQSSRLEERELDVFYSAIDTLTGEKLVVKIQDGAATAYLTPTRIIRQYEELSHIHVVKPIGETFH